MTPASLIASVEQRSRTLEQHLRQAERDLCDATEQQVQLEHRIASILGEIASLQLEHDPSLDHDTVQQLHRREQAQSALRVSLAETESAVAACLRQRDDLRERLDTLDEQAMDRLDQDPEFCRLAERLDAARQAEQGAQAAYEEIRDECATKLPAFWANPLYRFLKIRDYGTEQYRARGLRRWSDQLIALKVNFRANQASEHILLAMQARNEEQWLQRSSQLEQWEAEHRQQVDDARQATGMLPLQAEDRALVAHLSEAKAKANGLQAQLAEFAERSDPYFKRIAQRLAERLKARPLEDLMREAESTLDPRDDVLVKQLQQLHPALGEARQQLLQLQQKRDELLAIYERVKDAERALRSETSQGAHHAYQLALPIEQLLDNYLRNDMNLATLLMLVQAARVIAVAPSPSPSRRTTTRWTTTTAKTIKRSETTTSWSSNRSSGGNGFRTTDSF